MSEHVDFSQQVSAESDEGRLRPDMIVHLPAGRQVVVDAKVSLEAYLDAVEAADDDTRRAALTQHCRQIRDHIRQLAQKSYWAEFEPTPEFVVMFVPGESFLHAACSVDNAIIEEAMREGVVLASPTTLVALLRAVAYGWRQEQLAENAMKISSLGSELYDRVRTFASHLAEMGKRLTSTTQAYNKAIGSLESRVLPTARRFRELGAAGGDDLPEPQPVETSTRQLAAPEVSDEESP
jgi:DNA recombination protein RmuC